MEACVAANKLLEHDALVLADATVEALMPSSSSHSSRQTVQLLFALQKKPEAFDDHQKLFGMPITANLRNGWVATLFASIFKALRNFLKPQFKFLSVDAVQDWLGDFRTGAEPNRHPQDYLRASNSHILWLLEMSFYLGADTPLLI